MAAHKDLFGCPGESPWLARIIILKTLRFLFSPLTTPPLWPPKQRCLCNCRGRPIARSKVLAAKHTASLQLPCTTGGNRARLDARTKFEISQRSLKGRDEAPSCGGWKRQAVRAPAPRQYTPNFALAGRGVVRGQGLSHGPPRIRSLISKLF